MGEGRHGTHWTGILIAARLEWGRVDGWSSKTLYQNAIRDIDLSLAGIFLGRRQGTASP